MTHPPTHAEVQAARDRLRGAVVRTPLVRLGQGPPEIWAKLETLQPIGSFKIRGALNALATLAPEARAAGVITASAGNMGQGVAWGARALGIRCTVVVPEHAPAAKTDAIARLGADLLRVPFDRWWRALEERKLDGLAGTFVHPVSDPAVIAGNATIGWEILEDLPGADVVLVPFGGGGLSTGIAAALRAQGSSAAVLAVEPETAAPLAASFAAGAPVAIEYRSSFVDGAGGRSVLPEMWPLARELLAGAVVVSLAETEEAIRTLAREARVIAEGAGALAVAAARSGRVSGRAIVCVVSGGNIDLDRLAAILAGGRPDDLAGGTALP